jgi:5-methylcytosine-specific restriction endonuclease McrA
MPRLRFDTNGKLIPADTPKEKRRPARHLDPKRSWRSTYRWQKLRRSVIEEQPWCSKCAHTGSKDNPLSVDHRIAVENGGDPFARENCSVLCMKCNDEKGTS